MFDVVVVGAGVIGLTCAVRLGEAGARVLVLTAQEPEHTVSRIAAAVWYPTRAVPDPRLAGWGRRTFGVLAGQAELGVPGVVMRPTRMLLRREPGPDRPWWGTGVPDFRRVDPPPGYLAQWRFTAPSVEMGPYLRWLVDQVAGLGGVLRRQRLDRLVEAAELAPVLVNASGLGAGALADDPAVHPIRGRIVLVANPGLDTSVRDEQDPAGPTYVHPRRDDVVLGGTFEPDQTDLEPDPATSRAIVTRCAVLVPELAGVPVLAELTGLRPGRHGGPRLEPDLAGPARLIHNYGHGGAGVTLGWGCADEVANLVR